jgi:predicted NAD/FAD-dependent oxidoreductase
MVIIGAGLSGLLLARQLGARGERPVVLEKSRGFGGRLATKRLGEAACDSGAQFFTGRDPAFAALVEDWRQQGLVAPWPGSMQRWVGRPTMTAVPKALAAGVDVRREHKAVAVRRDSGAGTWTIALESGAELAATRLVLTCPVPQALALLDAGAVALPADTRAALDRLTYHPCLALLAVLDGPSAVPVEGVAPTEPPLRWVADNTKKGVSPGVPAAVTIHAAPEFSTAHYTAPEPEVTAALLAAARPWLGSAGVVATALHRWKFSEPKATHPERSLWLPELGLGFAGDSFGGPKVEGAALSGLDLAARLAR